MCPGLRRPLTLHFLKLSAIICWNISVRMEVSCLLWVPQLWRTSIWSTPMANKTPPSLLSFSPARIWIRFMVFGHAPPQFAILSFDRRNPLEGNLNHPNLHHPIWPFHLRSSTCWWWREYIAGWAGMEFYEIVKCAEFALHRDFERHFSVQPE